ncbi:MAG TPA: C39 family peptidase [Mesotoga sp.]|jgi:ABC-type bacteriocin/lantibiotic exporter with double-glycine peptidase domain|nr:C39 family peptidase [Mesotoga sp.]
MEKVSPWATISEDYVLLRLPMVRQSTCYTCGVASLQSILRYYGIERREDVLAAELGADYETGTNHRKIIEFSLANGFNVEKKLNMSIDDLKAFLRAGIPVMCVIQAWPDSPPIDWKDVWDCGHYVVAIGYDSERIFFMDPSTLGNYTYIPNEEFLDRWHDIDNDEVTMLFHLGIAIYMQQPDYNPEEFLKLE